MKYDIVFESENLLFVKPSIDLVDDYLIMVNDKDNQKFISKEAKHYTKEAEIEWVKSKIDYGYLFSIIEKSTGNFVGNIELMHKTEETAELGTCLTKNMQDKHYGSEAEEALLKYAFEVLDLDYLTARVYDYNGRSLHCAKKVGFNEIDRTDTEGIPGKFQEVNLRITKDDYFKNNKRKSI